MAAVAGLPLTAAQYCQQQGPCQHTGLVNVVGRPGPLRRAHPQNKVAHRDEGGCHPLHPAHAHARHS